MPTWLTSTMVLLSLVVMTACGSKPTATECKTACSNVAVVTLEHIQKLREDKSLKPVGEAHQDLAVEMAKGMLEAIRGDCMKLCQVKATRKMTTCLAGAKTLAEIDSCR